MKVLIIEDEKKIARTIKKGLEQEGLTADLAFDGEVGFDLASTEDYDVVILDLMLPKMSGVKICQKLRQEKIATPILMLTARGELKDKIKGLNLGADDYLTKPFEFAELLARLKALARRPKKTLGTILSLENLTLNTLHLEAKRNGKLLSLSKKEYALLDYLLRNKGRVVTKNQIINHVWDFDADILPNTVEVYIGYLRKKIGHPPLIQTIRGFGYKLEKSKNV